MKNKICLGTAKVGIPSYGHSTTNRSNNNDLFVRATEIGIDCFDTLSPNDVIPTQARIGIDTMLVDMSNQGKSKRIV